MAEESFYRDQILSNAAVLFDTTFRIVLRFKKVEGKAGYEALLLEGDSHKVLLAGPSGVHIQEALFGLLHESSAEMTIRLQDIADRQLKAEGKEPGDRELPIRK